MAEGIGLETRNYEPSRSLAAYLGKARAAWASVAVIDMKDDAAPVVARGTKISVEATVNLAGLSPEEVLVECYRGPLTSKGEIAAPERTEMEALSPEGNIWKYRALVNGTRTGQVGYSIRVLPKHPALGNRFIPGLVRWA